MAQCWGQEVASFRSSEGHEETKINKQKYISMILRPTTSSSTYFLLPKSFFMFSCLFISEMRSISSNCWHECFITTFYALANTMLKTQSCYFHCCYSNTFHSFDISFGNRTENNATLLRHLVKNKQKKKATQKPKNS